MSAFRAAGDGRHDEASAMLDKLLRRVRKASRCSVESWHEEQTLKLAADVHERAGHHDKAV
jgi:hypothetical protein